LKRSLFRRQNAVETHAPETEPKYLTYVPFKQVQGTLLNWRFAFNALFDKTLVQLLHILRLSNVSWWHMPLAHKSNVSDELNRLELLCFKLLKSVCNSCKWTFEICWCFVLSNGPNSFFLKHYMTPKIMWKEILYSFIHTWFTYDLEVLDK
jgi:hypothetical protein